jgi:predicted oxidoreductase
MSTRRDFIINTAAASVVAAASSISVAQAATNAVHATRSLKTCRIPQTNLDVSRIAYGTALLDFDRRGPDFVSVLKPALRNALEAGITIIDLADIYGAGQAETALGEVIRETPGLRHNVVIQSKCGLLLPGWSPGEPVPEVIEVDLTSQHIIGAVDGSLQRLGTDHLDILLLHAPDVLMQPEEVAHAFDELTRHGKVRHFGVSNHNIMQIELLRKHVHQPLVVNQVYLGLTHYSAIAGPLTTELGGIVDYSRLRDMQIQAFSPLRGGLLNPPPDAAPQLKHVAQLLADMGEKHATNASAIGLAWLLRHPAGIVPVIGATKPQYIADNCAADQVDLTHEEWQMLFRAAADIQPKEA